MNLHLLLVWRGDDDGDVFSVGHGAPSNPDSLQRWRAETTEDSTYLKRRWAHKYAKVNLLSKNLRVNSNLE